jgi:CYTH domain-containing protein
MFKLKHRAGSAGRQAYPYQIPNNEMGSMMDKMNRNLRDEIRTIAKTKGISAHLLVEIYLERAVKEYKTKGF